MRQLVKAAPAPKPAEKSADWIGAPKHIEGSLPGGAYALHPMLNLQRTIGNQAAGRLLRAGGIQAKLRISEPGDAYEQEADRVAQQVISTPARLSTVTGQASFQRQIREEDEVAQAKTLSATITPLVQSAPEEDESRANATVQRARADPLRSVEPGADLEARLSANGGGSQLPAGVRAFMEPRFGTDFSGVRLHTGSEAVQLSRAVGARAFTHGQHIYLGAGQNTLESSAGKKLLAHELTHTIQQGAAGTPGLPTADTARLIAQEFARTVQEPGATGTASAESLDTTWPGGGEHGGSSRTTLLQRNPDPQTKPAPQAKDEEAILIATVTFLEGDTPETVMKRALVRFGLSDPQASAFAAAMKTRYFGKPPKPGDPSPVYLTTDAVAALGKQIRAYEEGAPPAPLPQAARQKGEEERQPPGKGEGKAEEEAGSTEEGLGLIKVPTWVVTTLQALDVILTVVAVIEGAAALVAALKAIAKQVMKQAIKRAVREAAKEAAAELAKEALKTVTKKAAREGLEEAVKGATKQALKREIKKKAEQAAMKALKKSMKKAGEKEVRAAAKELAEEISEEVAEAEARKAAKTLIKEATKEFLTSSGILRNAAKAKIPLEKLTEYALNPAHPVGGNKAKIIEKLLGYTKSNYQPFLRQLEEGVIKNKAILGKADQFGQRFTVYIEMIGPKGKALVESGWIFLSGSDTPQLLTVFIP